MQASPGSADAPSDASSDAEPRPEAAAQGAAPNRAGLVRNTLYLTLAQAVTIPISVAANALAGRYLSSDEFGYMYLATTLCGFAVLALEWGQQGSLPALIATDNKNAPSYLGTSLAWRALLALPIAAVLYGFCVVFGYNSDIRWAVQLAFVAAVLFSLGGGFKDAIRGFERTDIPSYAHVAQQVLGLLAMVPVLLLGFKIRGLLVANIVVGGLIIIYLKRALRTVGVRHLQADRSTLKRLFSGGTPFVFFGLALVLQPNINVMYLSKLSPPEVVGWYGVSQRLIGLLIFPASALIGALYPTLCRLWVEDKDEFIRVSRGSLYGVAMLAIPATVGTGLFAELGVGIYGLEKYAGAVSHLHVMAAFVFLVYFSMPLGTALMAANQQKSWTIVQCICVVVSLAGGPILVPLFQAQSGNGGLGTCWTVVLSELLVVVCGIALCPRGIFDRNLVKSLSLAALSGAAMALVAWLLKPISLYLAVPASVATYGVVAWLTGALDQPTIGKIKGFVNRKLRRA